MKARDFQTREAACKAVAAEPVPVSGADRIGIARSARSLVPVHGMRTEPTPGVSGWYIWAGKMSDHEDFFEPSHVAHVPEVCPLIDPFLSLPPGWRFLTDGDYVDVWFDGNLLGDKGHRT